jgi:hypothetical protein
MSSIITKKQFSLTLIVLVLTTFMVAGSIVSSSSDNIAFAKHKNGQHIGQNNEQKQKAVCLTAGANSPVSGSCNNQAAANNNNNGGNAASGSGHGGSDQGIGQNNKQSQKTVCLTAGANSPVSGSCNNQAAANNNNNGGNARA